MKTLALLTAGSFALGAAVFAADNKTAPAEQAASHESIAVSTVILKGGG